MISNQSDQVGLNTEDTTTFTVGEPIIDETEAHQCERSSNPGIFQKCSNNQEGQAISRTQINCQNATSVTLTVKENNTAIIDNSSINTDIDKLKNNKGLFYVLVNRYDGVDLNGDMCRILILDGYPSFTSYEQLYSELRLESVKASLKAQIIEQGLDLIIFMTNIVTISRSLSSLS